MLCSVGFSMLRLPSSVQIRAETIPQVAQSEKKKKSQTLTLDPSFCLISVTIYNPVCIRRVMIKQRGLTQHKLP